MHFNTHENKQIMALEVYYVQQVKKMAIYALKKAIDDIEHEKSEQRWTRGEGG